MIALARKTIIHEWRRFLPVILSVGFAGVLLAVQAALVLGIFGTAALYVNASSADLWAGYPGTQSVSHGRQVSADAEFRLRMDPEVTAVEAYQWVDGDWVSDSIRSAGVPVYVSGISTAADALMFSTVLPADLRRRLREPGAVIVDKADLGTLGVTVGGRAWINRQQVHVVGVLPGLRGLGGTNVLSSWETARTIAGSDARDGSTYYVASLADPSRAPIVRQRMADIDPGFGRLEVWTARDFALRSQLQWLLETGAGVAVLFMALIVTLVGAIITNQSLSSIVSASAREYATLNALGASRGALARVVLVQACILGGLGLVLASVVSTILLALAAFYQVPVAMTPIVGLGCAALVAILALLSSVMACRSLMRTDPSILLR
ncbi:ABC transporter permease [Bordetella sp. N]|uniref:ABC transporter permease n=1 Tax=Bordetella sp. N TaxID=1746199 RepID=UPI00070EAC05|nr:FtsX-like permease family protein [Bordetella sp. N]ALM85203.1 ABC transporter permease [Bordetella sp. N]